MKDAASDCVAWASTEVSPEQFEARKTNARRNGYAAWLWPEIGAERWQRALDEIVTVARGVLAGESGLRLVCEDPRALCVAAYTSGMGPLLGYWIEREVLRATDEATALFDLHLAHNRRRMVRLSAVLDLVVGHLNAAGIAPVVLKGMDTATRFFPEPGTRPLSDIDIFIPANATSDAEQVFSRLGFRRVLRTRTPYACDWVDRSVPKQPRTLTFVHEDDPWSIDVLGSLERRFPTGAGAAFDKLLSHTIPADDRIEGRVRIMTQPLLALYLGAHFSQTLLNATILRALELVLVIRRDSADGVLDWREFAGAASTIGGMRFVYPALAFVEQLAPGTIPAEIVRAAAAVVPANLRDIVGNLRLAAAQPLHRHSVRERFMWAADWRERLFQVAGELSIDGRGAPLGTRAYSLGTKLWALRRRRYSP
jgi:hypothetical protein